jgi:integrase
MAFTESLILSRTRSGRVEGRSALIQPSGIGLQPRSRDRQTLARLSSRAATADASLFRGLSLPLLHRRRRGAVPLAGGRNPVEPLSARQLSRVVRAAAQAPGITKRVSPHTLRHPPGHSPGVATHLLEQGVDIRVIQTLLGHAMLDTTALYTHVANTTIRAVTSPLDRLASSRAGATGPADSGHSLPFR